MDSPECGVGGRVSTPAFFPTLDNSLVIAINHGWHAGLVKREQDGDEKLECDALCPPNVSSVVILVLVESPSTPPVADDDRQAVTGAGIQESLVVNCVWMVWDQDGRFGAKCM